MQVQADAGMHGDGFHDVANERTGKMPANHAVFEAFRLSGAHAVRAAGNVDHGLGQRLVERFASREDAGKIRYGHAVVRTSVLMDDNGITHIFTPEGGIVPPFG